jgi:phage terminase large subunit
MSANPNFIHLKRSIPENRFTLLQGGTRSGKTFSTIYYIIWLCDNYKGLEIDIVRDTFTALKATVWKDFKEVLVEHNSYSPLNHNKTDKIYNLNGNIISYYGADDPGKIHGRSRDILWLNEANQLDEETVDQLFPRTRHRVIMDYNPALPLEHWLDPYIIEYPPVITTYNDNPHLTAAQILDIERKRDNQYWWSVYGTGERAKPVGAIFSNWEVGEFDESLPYVIGMDFGFSRDPDTMLMVAIDKKRMTLYCKELLYSNSHSTNELIQIIGDLVEDKKTLIVADSAEPRTIEDIRQEGFNISGAKKGPDSIRNGIKKLMNYTIIVDKDSKNMVLEMTNYCWHNKKSETPIDDYNHLIDPLRYALEELDYVGMYFS